MIPKRDGRVVSLGIMATTRASKSQDGTVLTLAGGVMLPLGFFVIAGWRDKSGAAVPIGVAAILAGIAAGVWGLLLRWGRRQE